MRVYVVAANFRKVEGPGPTVAAAAAAEVLPDAPPAESKGVPRTSDLSYFIFICFGQCCID